MFDRIPLDGMVGEQRLNELIEEEKGWRKLPPSFRSQDILLDRFVRKAADSVNRRIGTGCE